MKIVKYDPRLPTLPPGPRQVRKPKPKPKPKAALAQAALFF
jgi:hypothetical protein